MINRYQNIQTTNYNQTGRVYYLNNIYPEVQLSENDNYVITTLGDRFDILANNFYGDTTLWWIIPAANSLPGDSLYPPIGIQLRLPSNIRNIIDAYNSINIIR
jgi:hypothetical protein